MVNILRCLIILFSFKSASAYTFTNPSSYFTVTAQAPDGWVKKINHVSTMILSHSNSGGESHATIARYGIQTDGARMITNAVKYVFNVMDTDKDGFITLQEFEAYVGTLSEEDREKFKNFSSTKDGLVSLKDFVTF